MIEFRNLIGEGFGSIRDEVYYDLSGGGITLVKGNNGSGKTTLFSLLFWTLYGNSLKNVTQSHIPTRKAERTNDFRGTRGIIQINIEGSEYLIARHIKFNGNTMDVKGGDSLLVFKDGIMMSHQHKKDSQEFIEHLIGMESNIFLNSILFGQKMKRFIDAPSNEKKEIFEAILDDDFIEVSRDKMKILVSDLQKKLDDKVKEHDKFDSKWNAEKSKLTFIEEQETNFDNLKKRDLELVEDEEQAIYAAVANYGKTIAAYEDKIQPIKDEINLEEHPYAAEITTANEELEGFKSDITELRLSHATIVEPKEPQLDCPTCERPLTKAIRDKLQKDYEDDLIVFNERTGSYEKAMKSLRESLTKTTADIAKLTSHLDTLRESNRKIVKHNEDQNQYANLIALEKTKQTMSKAEIHKILQRKKVIIDREFEAKDKTKILEAISEYSTRKTELVSEAASLSEDLTAHTWWVSTGFTSKGLRGYLFNSSLKLLNRAVEKYASRLGLRVVFSVDVTKASKPFVVECYMNGNLAEYGEFSGGEQAKIDIATAFAMHDLISAKTEFNILIMDEIFEGLDIENIDITFDLIRTKAEGRSVYVITHSQHVDSLNVKYLGVEKVNGTTILT